MHRQCKLKRALLYLNRLKSYFTMIGFYCKTFLSFLVREMSYSAYLMIILSFPKVNQPENLSTLWPLNLIIVCYIFLELRLFSLSINLSIPWQNKQLYKYVACHFHIQTRSNKPLILKSLLNASLHSHIRSESFINFQLRIHEFVNTE